ncbi:MAG: class II fructose-bisphosphate aldolase [Planctomycetaceae bacterium]|jgi:fructose-bisphosphate aldolase class II|nr:class II fructose-bisphosphate aldolase [Planctomycetaceae bacterium]
MRAKFSKVLRDAQSKKYAVAAINVLNHLTLSAVVTAAVRSRSPLIVQTSVATVKSFGIESFISFARPLIDLADVPVVLHLDHCQSIEFCGSCCELGWDSVMFDSSHLAFEENIKQTREVLKLAHGCGVEVEGEVGIIAGVEDDISHDIESLAGFDETMRYIGETDIDAIAPAVGTAHGVYKGIPVINFDLVQRLSEATRCPIVIHGGTGLTDETFRRLISCGASKINISTALKLVYTQSMKQYLNETTGTINPLKLDAYVTEKVIELAESLFALFGSKGQA